ncbi:type IV inositol polyphosphate 5-phosphatase 7-like [Zingiber officinale]|uniref:type IV inositol polyphosphate 5-phosphatase 7-like n=1 Tax=Zingiber officinale TaxID=94328 RepID=UPI001C4D4B38|nr:type IV inositol polyphosphate 5-phosphatase 7-like [Zingiber officinale]XP_042387462.1 type IV inositol polyphosphate 5-phosphatase 7-like [Zingiber officinale]
MKDENLKKSKSSWSKTVRKWFNIKNNPRDFHADDDVFGRGDGERRTSFMERKTSTVKKSRTERLYKNSDRVRQGRFDGDAAQVTDMQDYKIFVSTWNVGGKSPTKKLNLEEWIHASPPAHIYVLGFQEIVPLNAGNVLGSEDNIPAKKWLALIRKTLNTLPGMDGCGGGYGLPSPIANPVVELDADFEGYSTRQMNSSFFHRRSFHSISHSSRMDNDIMAMQPRLDRRFSVCDRVSIESAQSNFDPYFNFGASPYDEVVGGEISYTGFYSPMSYSYGAPHYMEGRDRLSGCSSSRYCLVASKQMVGIFLTVWVRSEIRSEIKNLKVSCVGRGLMGYLGNKGSIAISMSLHRTSFCFICTHLTSGEKEGDELRRNADVIEILRKTKFPRVRKVFNEMSPETILDHDRIIWLGDLNYRIALSYQSAKALVEMHNWRALLEKDQLRREQRCGHVFEGWKEGGISFPPTYKYSNNSDRYAGEDMHRKEKRRTPAWCDRILWYGRGLTQLAYLHGESRFSDHRPVYSVFNAEVEIINRNRIRSMGSSSRIEVEELLPYSHGFTETYY